ncbi:Fe-S cluster assembly ATPase SufC [Effusibacillus lacus]|uniref:Fe-S cluster assembly ATPase SufC n=1 Tax=Effusibacillus lacus TaxID=1348429 RepID=A0A292YE84_9BACL|nr:Fe-S cluster assembly ATPase SufC [Effusibacillus lacus]TCS76869.1 Fe-S cluster assembly ATP-binding protein [Effusibacillus lacus]GAX91202.1 Fe-S cluster assembly ATPase SufC [Effusibacillus lacus]
MADLVVKGLHVNVAGKEVLKGFDLTVKGGEVHAIMGPNGTGKTTLSMTLAGHPRYEVTNGQVTLGGKDLLEMEVDERAREGLFLAFQYPAEIPGVPVKNFLRQAYNAVKGTEMEVFEFYSIMQEKMQMMKMDMSFANRNLNEGFSGGEKKRHEILQMALLEPKIAILDETDSGLDIDALKIVADGVNKLRGPELGVLIITHYHRLLEYIKPDFVHVMMDGRIVRSGGPELALELEEKGYDWIRGQVSVGGEV